MNVYLIFINLSGIKSTETEKTCFLSAENAYVINLSLQIALKLFEKVAVKELIGKITTGIYCSIFALLSLI